MTSEQQSRLTIDYRNATSGMVGTDHGIDPSELQELAGTVSEQHDRLVREHDGDKQRWMDLADNTALADEIVAFADEVRDQYDDYLLIGIGGSSLGAIATVQALTHPYRNLLPKERRGGPRFFILDNPDPEKVAATLDT